MQFRVAKTSGVGHVSREFGYDLSQYGNLTPELVHDAARTAKVLEFQKQLATALNRHLDKIYANKAEIERLTLEATEKGLTDKAEIDKYVVKAIVAGAKHDSAHCQFRAKIAARIGLDKGTKREYPNPAKCRFPAATCY
jgi:hypothetical protein